MSTYYNMCCHDHMERTSAASRTAGGHCHLGDSGHTLLPFVIAHAGCNVEILDEWQDGSYNDEYQDWTEDNVEEMIQKARNDGRWR